MRMSCFRKQGALKRKKMNKKEIEMKKILNVLAIIVVVIFAGYNVCKAQQPVVMSDIAMGNVEALASCESRDGYDLSRHCIPATNRCYVWDFVAEDCISNIA